MRNYLTIGALAAALVSGLMIPTSAAAVPSDKSGSHDGKVAVQTFHVGSWVTPTPVEVPQYTATSEQQAAANRQAALNAKAAKINASFHVGPGVAMELAQSGDTRTQVVETALSYLGTPYVLGGMSHQSIDCSGLTALAYAAVGVPMVHYVPNQDDMAQPLPQNGMRPGDLMIFDDDEHVAIYIGQGLLIAAPAPGRSVEIEAVSDWNGIGWHGGRILP